MKSWNKGSTVLLACPQLSKEIKSLACPQLSKEIKSLACPQLSKEIKSLACPQLSKEIKSPAGFVRQGRNTIFMWGVVRKVRLPQSYHTLFAYCIMLITPRLLHHAYYIQACRVVRYGTMTVCTVRTVLVELRRTTVIVTPYFTVITVKYGTVYGTVPSWHCQCKNGLRMASPPQNLPFSLRSVILPCADATQCFHDRP